MAFIPPQWAVKAGSFIVKKGAQALKTGFSAKSGSSTLSYTPPKMSAGKTSTVPTGDGMMSYLKNPVVLGGLGLALFLILKK